MSDRKKIVVKKDGPYVVSGNVPLVSKDQVVSERGEPLTWEKGEDFATKETYLLCRCGKSRNKPYCDGAHTGSDFDGTESADTRKTAERQATYPGSTYIEVKHDDYLCTNSGFCGNRMTKIAQMISSTDDICVRTQVISMVEHCPSGALVYSLQKGAPAIEPDLPQQIAVTTECTSTRGPFAGPLWVTGGIPVERADGLPIETRNRVTLCSCGRSKKKPLCDGSHRHIDVEKTKETKD